MAAGLLDDPSDESRVQLLQQLSQGRAESFTTSHAARAVAARSAQDAGASALPFQHPALDFGITEQRHRRRAQDDHETRRFPATDAREFGLHGSNLATGA